MTVLLQTGYGLLRGNKREHCNEFLGIRYARAGRFEYAVPVDHAENEDEYDATRFGGVCPQLRTYYEHLEIPERKFYHREFRNGISYRYDEDCLNLNIYAPEEATKAPVIIFIHGGGFDSGTTKDSCIDGDAFCKRGIVFVTINYRVGVLGYLTHKKIESAYGHDGNFGLDDQVVAIEWVKRHIKDFGGDPGNITLMGQSAGAISIQYLCLSPDNQGLFQHAVMMSGGGMFPKFALPRPAEKTHEYWLQLMDIAGCNSLDELKKLGLKELFTAIEEIKKKRKDNTYNTMPVIDEYHIPEPVDVLIDNPLRIDYMIGFTNNDLYAPIKASIGTKFASANSGYVYYFDIDAPGDDSNGAFHSSDMRYMFHTLSKSHRPYTKRDEEISDLMIDYVASFATSGNPNEKGRPKWKNTPGTALCIGPRSVAMGKPFMPKLWWNMLAKGEPK